MLLRTIFMLALIAIAGEAIVHAAGALARAALHQRALDAARTALAAAVSQAQATIALAVEANPGTAGVPLPAPTATCAYADANGCQLNVQTVFATPTPAAAPAPSACPQTDCVVMLQGNTAVAEGRVTWLITTTVTASAGAQLATRSGIAAFRTYGVPPYASLAGGVDASIDALMTGGVADDAGSPASLITVQYAPSGGGTGRSGNVWQPVTQTSAMTAPAWQR